MNYVDKENFLKSKLTPALATFQSQMESANSHLTRRMKKGQFAILGDSFYVPVNAKKQVDCALNCALNSIDTPSYTPTGLAALPYAMGDIYKQEQFMGVTDKNNQPVQLEDFINIKHKPQFAWKQEKVLVKKAVSYGARSPEELASKYFKGPGQHNLDNPMTYNDIYDSQKESIYIYYTGMQFDEISNKQATEAGLDWNQDAMESIYRSAAIDRRRSLVCGTSEKTGLLRLGNQQVVTSEEGGNILGITTAKKLVNYTYNDHKKLAQRMNAVRRGVVNGTHVNWGSKVIVGVPSSVFVAWKSPLQIDQNDAGNAYQACNYKTAIDYYEAVASVQIVDIPELSANDAFNPNGSNDCLLFMDYNAAECDEVMPFGMFGNIVQQNPILSTVSFLSQETRVYPIWNDRIYKIIGI